MKKYLILLTFLAVALSASAKFRWGPTVGVDFLHYTWSQSLLKSEMKPGFGVGVQCEVMIPGIGFGIDFGLKYVNRGGYLNFGDFPVWNSDNISSTNLRMHTVQVPANVRYKYSRLNGVENIVAPYVFGGPQFNFNVANSKCDAINRYNFSVGLGCGIGAELFKRYQISAGYLWDVTDDLSTKKLDDFTGALQGWFVDLCVLF